MDSEAQQIRSTSQVVRQFDVGNGEAYPVYKVIDFHYGLYVASDGSHYVSYYTSERPLYTGDAIEKGYSLSLLSSYRDKMTIGTENEIIIRGKMIFMYHG